MGNRLYVGNLPYQTGEEEIRAAFANCGEVTDVRLMTDRDTGRSRGFAFVTMATDQMAQQAISDLDGATLEGRALRVNEAEDRRGGGGGGGRRGNDRDFGRGRDSGGGRGGRSGRGGGGGGGGGRW